MSVLVFFSLPTELQKYSSTGKGLTNSVFGKWKASTDSSKQLWDKSARNSYLTLTQTEHLAGISSNT